ncbi:MAG: MiaB/RimO family radical SAM methylthiotransferase [Bacteroidales bacterium]|nr:MiaB/RimO family radical SAM methylthiotransferase [Bacteroidales bacterium]
MRFYIYTLGCKVNYSESAEISKILEKSGWHQVPNPQDANLIIIHSCAVTAQAEKKTRQAYSRFKKLNPLAQFAILGCAINLNKNDYINLLEKNDLLLNNEEKFHIVSFLTNQENINHLPFKISYNLEDRVRSFLKIQDGCDYYCSYCAIPYARGKSRNASISEVLSVIEHILKSGIKEIVLTGINIASFKTDDGKDYYDLLKAIHQQFSHEKIRIRIGNPEPNLLRREIIELVAESPLFMPHFHIPLQSGSNLILEKMNRKYTSQEYANLILTIKSYIPDACIAADVITGFPSETKALFNETYSFISDLPISYLHVFSYSDRPQARSFSYPMKLTPSEIQSRTNELIKLSDSKWQEFLNSQKGKIRPVLIEKCKGKFCEGYTDNYIYCQIEGKFMHNTITNVLLDEIDSESLNMIGKSIAHD